MSAENTPHPTVAQAKASLRDLIRCAETAIGILEAGGTWRDYDESPINVWGIPATMQLGGRFAILDLKQVAEKFPCRT